MFSNSVVKKCPRLQIHDLPTFLAHLHFQSQLIVPAYWCIRRTRNFFNFEIHLRDATSAFRSGFGDAKVHTEGIVPLEQRGYLILEVDVAVHAVGIES